MYSDNDVGDDSDNGDDGRCIGDVDVVNANCCVNPDEVHPNKIK